MSLYAVRRPAPPRRQDRGVFGLPGALCAPQCTKSSPEPEPSQQNEPGTKERDDRNERDYRYHSGLVTAPWVLRTRSAADPSLPSATCQVRKCPTRAAADHRSHGELVIASVGPWNSAATPVADDPSAMPSATSNHRAGRVAPAATTGHRTTPLSHAGWIPGIPPLIVS
jgi:hypothetical protein